MIMSGKLVISDNNHLATGFANKIFALQIGHLRLIYKILNLPFLNDMAKMIKVALTRFMLCTVLIDIYFSVTLLS